MGPAPAQSDQPFPPTGSTPTAGRGDPSGPRPPGTPGRPGIGADDNAGPVLSARAAADLDLMQRVATGTPGAIEELYDRFGSLVYRKAIETMPTRPEAEDATQEVFVRLWRTAAKFDPTKAALVTWVMLLTRRHLVDKLRRNRIRPKPAPLSENADGPGGPIAIDPLSNRAGQQVLEREDFDRLLERVEALPELQRTVIQRAYLGGQTLRQISQELDTPLGTIKSALSRALVRLREWSER